MKLKYTLPVAALALSCQAFAQTKWDLPAAYPASNFHTENLVQFASDVEKATGGKLKIQVHAERLPVQGARDQARRARRAGPAGRDPAGQLRQ